MNTQAERESLIHEIDMAGYCFDPFALRVVAAFQTCFVYIEYDRNEGTHHVGRFYRNTCTKAGYFDMTGPIVEGAAWVEAQLAFHKACVAELEMITGA